MSFTPQSSTANINGNSYQLIAFYYPGHNEPWDDYYKAPFFGNFWQAPLTMTINGITASFHTAEAAFQSTKWWSNSTMRNKFEQALTGNEAFKIKKHATEHADYSYAGLGRDGAMMTVLEAKFKDPVLKAGLLGTNDAYLLEHNSVKGRDNYWSDDHDGSGQNMLGRSLMTLRKNMGGQDSPYSGSVADMTDNVQTVTAGAASPSSPNKAAVVGKLKIIPSVYRDDGEEGDFGWMILQPKYKKSFFIFNDNVSKFEKHQKDSSDPNGCTIGGGNAVIRPYQCHTPPKAGGIPTGPSFTRLTADVKAMIDAAMVTIKQGIKAGGYDSVVYSSNGHGGLGTSIFKVPDDVKTFIIQEINSLAK